MIKLFLIALIALTILGTIIYFIFTPTNKSETTKLPTTTKTQTTPSLAEIKIEDVKLSEPPKPVLINLYTPKASTSSGYVRLSQLVGKTLIQLKSDDTKDKIGLIFKGNCSANPQIVYPLVSLIDGKSQTIWDTDFANIKSQLPLSIKTFKDMKNLKSYTRCAEIKMP